MESEVMDKTNSSKDKQPFSLKLYNVVNTAPYITWASDGDSFYINDVHKFESEVMKDCFNNACMLSFVRQLHIYGFRRLLDGRRTRYQTPTNYASFYHPCFKRDHPELLSQVQRQKRKKSTGEISAPKPEKTKSNTPKYISQESKSSTKVKAIRPKPTSNNTVHKLNSFNPSNEIVPIVANATPMDGLDPALHNVIKAQTILEAPHLNLAQADGSILDPTQANEILAQYPELFAETGILTAGKTSRQQKSKGKTSKKKMDTFSDGGSDDSDDSGFNPVFTIDASTNPPFLTYLHDPSQPHRKLKGDGISSNGKFIKTNH